MYCGNFNIFSSFFLFKFGVTIILSTNLDNKVVSFGSLICVFHLCNVIKFWLILTNLKYDNLDKMWVFICFLKKLTKTLEKKNVQRNRKKPREMVDKYQRDGLAIFSHATYLEMWAISLLASFSLQALEESPSRKKGQYL